GDFMSVRVGGDGRPRALAPRSAGIGVVGLSRPGSRDVAPQPLQQPVLDRVAEKVRSPPETGRNKDEEGAARQSMGGRLKGAQPSGLLPRLASAGGEPAVPAGGRVPGVVATTNRTRGSGTGVPSRWRGPHRQLY